jgi:type III pantothenate kinase
MLLAIDIGNTNITLGIFNEKQLITTWRLATRISHTADEYGIMLLTLSHQHKLLISDISGAILCSVVPPLVPIWVEACKKYLDLSPIIVEAGIKTGVCVSVDNPREVGPDRIVNTVAAFNLYKGPAIVIDLGTATTFDVISREGNYLGGAIAPGIDVASEALFAHTAMLPLVELARPKQAIGRNTISAMQSGIVFGYAGLIEGIITRIEQEMKDKARIVATGGYAQILANEVPMIDIVNPDLSLIGLRLIYEMNKEQ